MKVTLKRYTADAENAIGDDAAICYGGKTDRDSNIKRASHCKDRGHLVTMRFAYATVHIEGISRVCSHQLVRMAHAGILQESQRYVMQSRIEYVRPPALAKVPRWFQWLWDAHLGIADWLYLTAIRLGMKKEDARYILSQSCTTRVNLCLNFQAWQDFLRLRTSKSAQWEIRELAVEIERQLHGIAPHLF